MKKMVLFIIFIIKLFAINAYSKHNIIYNMQAYCIKETGYWGKYIGSRNGLLVPMFSEGKIVQCKVIKIKHYIFKSDDIEIEFYIIKNNGVKKVIITN